MAGESHLRVTNPPCKPVLIWDGDCAFCARWIERWKRETRGAVDYATSQDVAERFPAIPEDQFKRSVVLIEADGNVFVGAEAVFRSLALGSSTKWLAWSYDHIPGFAKISEVAYRIVAANRTAASIITKVLWGKDVRPSTYHRARRWFLRLLGLTYLIAFLSLWVQVDGLIGTDGILPVSQFLTRVHDHFGAGAFGILPTLCWFGSTNTFLHFLCGGGVVLSLCLMAGVAPAASLLGLFTFYLSLTIAGQTFLSFQWDILLLETGFLAIFLAPWQLWWKRSDDPPISRIAFFLLKFLLLKLMLMSGIVKLTSGDDCWWNLSALNYHYWSQPLPTALAWWADQHAEWFKRFSVGFCLAVEIVVPFLMWAPRNLRMLAAGLLIFLQVAIAATGNYCFFNLLTIALCLLLIDDGVWSRRSSSKNLAMEGRAPASPTQDNGAHSASQELRPPFRALVAKFQGAAAIVVLIVTLPLNLWLIYSAFEPEADRPRPIAALAEWVEPFRIVNGYGLFRVMTKDRGEIVVEGSADGIDWRAYEFKWKPGDVNRPPGWCAPHQPRLDWQMWFAALGSPSQNPWFVRLAECLMENKRDVIQLLERNPFPEAPPRYVRATFYRYRFTTSAERQQTGAWWKREELGEYLPSVSLR